MTGQPRKKSRPEKHADNDNAVKAILHAIDQLDVKLETKEQQCKEIAKVIKQKKLTYQDGDTRSVYDEEWLRTSFNSTLGNQLVSSYLHYNPRHKPIWEHGSKAIRTSYLELIGFISNETESESEERAPEAHVDAIARPTECSFVKGSEQCTGGPAKLFKAGKGFYCKPCVEHAEDELSMRDVGGCSNPHHNVSCLGSKFKGPYFLEGHVLCASCHAHFQEGEELRKSRSTAMKRSSSSEVQPLRSPEISQAPQANAGPDVVILDDEPEPTVEQALCAEGVASHNPKRDAVQKRSADELEDRATGSSTSALLPPPKRQRRDALHQSRDTGIGSTIVQAEMKDIFGLLEKASFQLHRDTKLDTNSEARLLSDKVLCDYAPLQAAYGTLLGSDTKKIRDMTLNGVLISHDTLVGLLGAFFYRSVFVHEADIPALILSSCSLEAMKAEFGIEDEDMADVRARLAFREVTSEAFVDHTAPKAAELVDDIVKELSPHLSHLMKQLDIQPRASLWCPSFEETLQTAVQKALMLKARFKVSGQSYSMMWFPTDTKFDRRKMQELNQTRKQGDLSIIMSLFPGWKCGDDVVAQARVSLDVTRGET